MNRNIVVVVLLLALALSMRADAPAEETFEPGTGKYILVLIDPNTDAADAKTGKKAKEPDVAKHGGKVLSKRGRARVIKLPVAAAKALRKEENVAYVQRVWLGEPLQNWDPEENAATAPPPEGEMSLQTDLTWQTGTYLYDGSGNIKQIGGNTYTYDSAGRLIRAVVGNVTETYQYDSFGNLLQKTTGTTAAAIPVDTGSNRLVGETYDPAGNATTRAGQQAYVYDSLSMMETARDATGGTRRMLYGPDEERVAVIHEENLMRWTFRDFAGRVLREFQGDCCTWEWMQDYVHGEGRLLGGIRENYFRGRRHFHVDHLGTTRLITDASRTMISAHDFYPFGIEQTDPEFERKAVNLPMQLDRRSRTEPLKYTSHEREFLGWYNWENTEYLDYMHARFYDPNKGRFLSVDPAPESVVLEIPQSWNRYSYALNNPINITDPTGRVPCRYKLSGSDAETAGVPDGTVVDGECVEAEADLPLKERMLQWVGEHERVVAEIGNVATGFSDTLTFDATKNLREHMGDDQVVNPCSASYRGGQVAGVLWWTAAGGGIGGKVRGGSLAASELGNITLTNSAYAARGLEGLSAAEKLAALGGARGATMQALKNAGNPAWWGTVARTTFTTGPTPAGWGGVAGLGVGGASVATADADDGC